MKTKIIQNIKSIILALILTIGVSYVFAAGTWSNPPAGTIPPGNNVDTPLNVGSISQTKTAGLWLKGLNAAGAVLANSLIVENGKVGIGTVNPIEKLDVIGTVKTTGLQVTGGTTPITAGQVLTAVDSTGKAEWAGGGGGAGLLKGTLTIASPVTIAIGWPATNATPYSVSVPGAAVGDLAQVAFPANYDYASTNHVCGAATASVSAAGTVKVHFWNPYQGTQGFTWVNCTIPAGVYSIYVIKSSVGFSGGSSSSGPVFITPVSVGSWSSVNTTATYSGGAVPAGAKAVILQGRRRLYFVRR